MKRIVTRTALAAAGALLGVVGGALMLAPQYFLATSRVVIESDPGLMSELAAPAGLLLVAGVLMVSGAIRIRLADRALVAGSIVYGSYGAGRVISMMLHGLPSDALVAATVIELSVAAVLTGLWRSGLSRKPPLDADDDLRGAIV
jgi:hypothetical protein